MLEPGNLNLGQTKLWFPILSCQETFPIGYNLSFPIKGGKTLVTFTEGLNKKYYRHNTFCVYRSINDLKDIELNLQSSWESRAHVSTLPYPQIPEHPSEMDTIFWSSTFIISWVPTDLCLYPTFPIFLEQVEV